MAPDGDGEWQDAVTTYCVSLGLQLGFQTFSPRQAAEGLPTRWHPATAFIAVHSLTAALRDVGSRTPTAAAPGAPPSMAALACAARALHATIFQPYHTWLRAVRLKPPPSRPARQLPDAESMHQDLADLSLYWLIYCEAANLRHTPEMLWFIFFCAQRSWQVKQVLGHLRMHRDVLAALPQQLWMQQLGPGLQQALRTLHDQHRGCTPAGGGGGGGGGLQGEATLMLPGGGGADVLRLPSAVDDAVALALYGNAAVTTAATAAAADAAAASDSRSAVRITVLADGSVSMPYNPYGKEVNNRRTTATGADGSSVCSSYDGDGPWGHRHEGHAAAASSAGCAGGGRRRMGPTTCPESPNLPLPPHTRSNTATTFTTTSSTPGMSILTTTTTASAPANAAPKTSAFATAGAAASLAAVHAPAASAAPRHHLLPTQASTPMAPNWDPAAAPRSYRELLLRLCPNEAAVAAALADGGGGGEGGEGADKGGRAGASQFLTRVVQPLFLFLSEQVFELGQARRQGLEAAVRLGYDDVTESMAHPAVVAAALGALPWATPAPTNVVVSSGGAAKPNAAPHAPQQQQQHQQRQRASVHEDEQYWSRLLALNDLAPSGVPRIPWQGDMAHYKPQLLRLLRGGPGSGREGGGEGGGEGRGGGAHPWRGMVGGDEEAPAMTSDQVSQAAAAAQCVAPAAAAEVGRLRSANAAADWWGRHVLRKTFQEHRSLAMPLIAFARIYQFQLCWFYLLCAWSWSDTDTVMHWIASAAALHWGTNCLLWSMQAVMSTGATLKRAGVVVPFHSSAAGRARRSSGPSAPASTHGLLWWLLQLLLLGLCWGLLGAGLYIAYIVWPKHDFYGYTCYPLFWGRSCYWWIAAVYAALVLSYEMLYRQFNLGGYARSHLYDLALRIMPGGGATSASSSASPLYDPAVHLPTGLPYLLGNAALWGAALSLKFAIDYFILVRPAGRRLAEVLATDKLAWKVHVGWSWWPVGWPRNLNFDLDPCMAAAQVLVLFLLSLVSSGVAYSLACAVWGSLQGVRQGVGSIRHWGHIRSGFHRVQMEMRAKLLTPEAERAPPTGSWPLRVAAASFRAAGTVVLLPFTGVAALLRWLGCLPVPADGRPKSWEQREETMSVTAPFWNAVVQSLRGRDLLNDREAAALSFAAVSLSPASMLATWRRGGSIVTQGRESLGIEARGPRETYLPPVAVYVAQIPQMVSGSSSASAEQQEVLQEAYLYLLHLLVAVGAVPRAAPSAAAASMAAAEARQGVHASAASATSTSSAAAPPAPAAYCPDLHKDNFHPDKFAAMPPRASTHRRLVARRELLGAVVGLVKALVEASKAYKDTAAAVQPQAGGGGGSEAGGGPHSTAASAASAAKTRSRALERMCMALHAVARCLTKMHDLPWSVAVIANRVVVRQHYHQPAVKAQLDRGFNGLLAANRRNESAWGAEHIPTYEDFAKVSNWLLAILRPSDEGTAPSNPEAVALLADFCSGLTHPDLPIAPRVDAMRSVSTLIPHYQETVLYALSSADARRVLQRAAARSAAEAGSAAEAAATAASAASLEGSLGEDEVLFKNDEGAYSELLQYLVSEFPDEIRNLLERCRTLVPLPKDQPPYMLEDFLPYGRLYEHRAQLLLWASFRGQVLARTVDGMCMYRTALAMQAVQDAVTGGGRGGGNKAGGGGDGGRIRLSGVQRMMVRGILKDPGLCVEELVAQLSDVVPGLGPLLDQKYGLVVSSQVFAKMAASRSLADRWRAHGIALLATRYPSMRVAYLEADGEPLTLFQAPDFTYRVEHTASVLVRAEPLERELQERRRARAERDAAAEATASSLGMYDLGPSAAGGGAAGGAGAGDGVSTLGGGGSDEEEEEDGDEGDAGAALRLWRRRHQLRNLDAAELEVLFRQQLPVNYYDTAAAGVGVILGEGKPENQNTAVPYCPGVLLQTIDMNQDNSLAQAFKLRNATREFEPLGPGAQHQQVAVLGYPEWIFSYRCGLLADLAAATERTFGTQIQRAMAFPSAVRTHYGHPDLWNRLFSMTRGGVSKANAVQHVSEDVFGGMNALKRGGLSKYCSYISVGKGRDMGLDSILGFEGKISKGCAEQLMSRDLRFLGSHMDFFRSMSLYHTSPGHFINTWLTVVTIHMGIWVQLLLLLGGVGSKEGNSSFASAIGAVQILQLGSFPLLGYLFNLWLESGLATALATLARQIIGGGLLFHIFRSTTSAYHLGRAVLFGGASYVATGRGFSLRRKTFTQVYVNYGRSHLYMGADILIMVILILVAGNNGGNALPVPAAAMWSPLLVSAALLAGPFWFTPFFFRLNQVLRDTREFRGWVAGSGARGVAEGWAEWNAGQLSPLRDDGRTQVRRYRFWSTLAVVLPRAVVAILSAIVAVTGARFDAASVPDLYWVLGGSLASWALLALWAAGRRAYLTSGLGHGWRWFKGIVQAVTMVAVAALAAVCLFMPKKGLRFSGVLITLYANYQVASLAATVAVAWLPKTMVARRLSNAAYQHADAALGTALAAVLILICFIGEIGLVMVDKVQTLVQFNDRFSHSQAARPFAGEDDPAGGGGGGGGGGGMLAAAAAAAMRRRAPTPPNALAQVSGGGGGGGGALPRGSEPSSAMQGWVSPGFRAGGAATPVLVYGSTNVGAVMARAGGGTTPVGAGGTTPTAAAVAARLGGGGGGGGGNTTTASFFLPPSAPDAAAQPFQRPPLSRLGSEIRGGGGSGADAGPAGKHRATLSSHDLPWSSAALPLPLGRQGSTQGRTSGGGGAVPPLAAEGSAARVSGGGGGGAPAQLPALASRLPPSGEWHQVAVAAAEVAAAAAAARPVTVTYPQQPHHPRYPQVQPQPPQQAAEHAQQPVQVQVQQQQPRPQQLQLQPLSADNPQDDLGVRYPPVPAWGVRQQPPAASPAASAGGGGTTPASASSASTTGSSAAPWAVPAPPRAPAVSPMRARQMPRPLSASPDLPPIRPSPRRLSVGGGGGGQAGTLDGGVVGGGILGGARFQSPERAGRRVSGGGGGGGGGGGAGSYSGPAAPVMADGPLSGWVQPKAMPYEPPVARSDGGGGRAGAGGAAGRAAGGGTGGVA